MLLQQLLEYSIIAKFRLTTDSTRRGLEPMTVFLALASHAHEIERNSSVLGDAEMLGWYSGVFVVVYETTLHYGFEM
jgi:hypothetical protein